jgi:hypothetical protein
MTIKDKFRDRTSHDVVFVFGTGLTLIVNLVQKLKKMKTAESEYEHCTTMISCFLYILTLKILSIL